MISIFNRIRNWGRQFLPAPTPAPVPAVVQLRGTNLVGMEGKYWTGTPVANSDYPVFDTAEVDYFVSKGATIIRLLFSWERMQKDLYGPFPAYQAYYDSYKKIVDYATSKGLTVLCEPWQLGAKGDTGGFTWRGYQPTDIYTYADFWSKFARAFKDNLKVQIGLANEPNNMSTLGWFATAQKCVDYIRATGFANTIVVPGNGWTNAHTWNDSWYDTDPVKRSNAYGWLNANGPGKPLYDPLNKLVVGVHSYCDSGGGGGTTEVVSGTISRQRVKVAVDWARTNGLKVFVGEIGSYAVVANAAANWADFVAYANSVKDVLTGYCWWAAGKKSWWDDVAANGGGHFSITPTNNYTTDTVNMKMIGRFT